MLLDTIVLVLRETLEAGILIALLLSITNDKGIGKLWLWAGLILGALSAYAYSHSYDCISESLEYAGQEVLNAAILLTISLCLMSIVFWLIFRITYFNRIMPVIFASVIVFTLTRELTELVIFYTGFFQTKGDLANGLTSGFIGLTIGSSIGVIVYYSITSWIKRGTKCIRVVFLTLVSGGLVVQALQLLMQVDWISSTQPLWNTNSIIKESSAFGQMVYAVFGYEATPTFIEVIGYITIISLPVLMIVISNIQKSKNIHET